MSTARPLPEETGGAEAEVGLGWGEAVGPAAAGPSEPLLGRAERAALLRAERGEPRPAVLAMVGGGSARYERWPVLELVLERFRERLRTSLRELSTADVDLALEGIGARRFAEHLESLPRPIPIAVLRAIEWEGCGLVILDRALAFTLVDLLLGGGRAVAPTTGQARGFTSIERALIERFVGLLGADLGRAFEPVVPVRFTVERIETDPRFATVARPAESCVLMTLRIALAGRGGTLALLLPYATLEPAREVLREMVTGEKLGRDPAWERHLASRIRGARIELVAVLGERTTSLREVVELRVGSVLVLGARPDSPVVLRCNGLPVLTGKLGRVGERVSVRIEDRIGGARED
ncbi:MAG: FliM/FliN family flagellar motor switch protein [Geminicoccaceae bacterium]|nr:FliM/FliN family flagellar motor switch protein [Geminicoccaceae bacterium]